MLKKILFTVLTVLMFAAVASAQNPDVSSGSVYWRLNPVNTTGNTGWIEVDAYGPNYVGVSFTITGSPSAVTTTLYCSRNGGTTSTTVGTSSSTTGATISGTAYCTHIEASFAITGSASIVPTLFVTNTALQFGPSNSFGCWATSDTQVLFNDAGNCGGDSGLTFNKTTDTLSIGSGGLTLAGSSSGSAAIVAPAAAGSPTLTLPTVTATLASRTGSFTTDHCIKVDSNTRFVDSGSACGSGTISGTIASTQIAYGASADTIAGNASLVRDATSGGIQFNAQPVVFGFSDTANSSEPSLAVMKAGGGGVSFGVLSSYTDPDHWKGLLLWNLSDTTYTINSMIDGGWGATALQLVSGSGGILLNATGGGDVRFNSDSVVNNGKVIKSDDTDAHTFSLSAYDVDGMAYAPLITLTNANAPTLSFPHLACPMGQTAPLMIDDAGVVTKGSCS